MSRSTILIQNKPGLSVQHKQMIMLDGMNLSLPKGTGVATYCRQTIAALQSCNYDVALAFGQNVKREADEQTFVVDFADSLGNQRPYKKRMSGYIWDIAKAGRISRLDYVPKLDSVISVPLRNAIPEAVKHVLNGENLFKKAELVSKYLKRPAIVSSPIHIDVAHWTYPIPIQLQNSKNIYTFHDLVPIKLPHATLDQKKDYIERCRSLIAIADHVVTVSENSRRDIIDFFGINPDKVTNTYQSVSLPEEILTETELDSSSYISGLLNIDKDEYFLFYGALEPKKNIGRLIEAYLGSLVERPLVIVGAPGWKQDSEMALFDSISKIQSRNAQRIIFLEYLPRALLIRLLRGARALLFPALYEGFGLPVAEAQLLGVPVVSSNTGSIPEITGNRAVLVNPYQTTDICNAIKRIDRDAALRDELRIAGKEQSLLFTQSSYAKRLDQMYKKIL
jgi:glycosyltransferase involved in cell wall biosynthesis